MAVKMQVLIYDSGTDRDCAYSRRSGMDVESNVETTK